MHVFILLSSKQHDISSSVCVGGGITANVMEIFLIIFVFTQYLYVGL